MKFSNFHLGLGSSSDESECACATKFVFVIISPMKRERSCIAEIAATERTMARIETERKKDER